MAVKKPNTFCNAWEVNILILWPDEREKNPHIVTFSILWEQRKQLKNEGENMREFIIIE